MVLGQRVLDLRVGRSLREFGDGELVRGARLDRLRVRDDAVPEVVPDEEAAAGLVKGGWMVTLRERKRYGATRRGNRRNDLLS